MPHLALAFCLVYANEADLHSANRAVTFIVHCVTARGVSQRVMFNDYVLRHSFWHTADYAKFGAFVTRNWITQQAGRTAQPARNSRRQGQRRGASHVRRKRLAVRVIQAISHVICS